MRFIAKTLYGLETVLARELADLGASNIETANRAVIFDGAKDLLYEANYCSRTALSLLMPVAEFRIKSKDDLYKGCLKIKWEGLMDEESTFSIVPVVNSPLFTHTGYAGLVVKDAVADYFRNRNGKRPSVNQNDPDLLINLHISNDRVTVSIDSSVVPLFKRGYRLEQTAAPLNESLAAGILLISGWNAKSVLLDPMCGSGTIPIEAALIACSIPPGKFRRSFGFQRWKDYDEDLFNKVKEKAEGRIIGSPVDIYASDISPEAVKLAEANIRRAGLADVIKVQVSDFKDFKCIDDQGVVVMNPPYGLRLNPDELDAIYGMIGSTLKHSFSGNTAWLITSNRESLKKVGLKPAQKHILFNGALECLLLKYELYKGSMKVQEH
ncbi:MAG: class I SAM-dependent RNA methyltransferase [Bacteroidetes bacterium]|nr:class I SAM-dependent RNA methyltransferase [Bacteroidota bacterium]